MLAKKTVKNQITLPKKIAEEFPGVEYFEVSREGDRIVLEPVRTRAAWEVREKLAALGVREGDVAGAVAWAREVGKNEDEKQTNKKKKTNPRS